ncbi:hypothetical protein D3P07_19910 [Paenibacillus sp. 1011MAR3C5]|nr:hypothetical protein D3P07_19910 [Paenibacillus sp. 1011MAR3C5]
MPWEDAERIGVFLLFPQCEARLKVGPMGKTDTESVGQVSLREWAEQVIGQPMFRNCVHSICPRF